MLAECADLKLDIVLLLDTSGSVGKDNFGKVLDFAKGLINLVSIDNDDIRVGVIQFATDVKPIFYLNDFIKDKDSMLDAIDNIVYEGGKTNTAGAIRLAVEKFFTEMRGSRPGTKKHCISVTDGKSTVNSEDTIPAANYARQMGVHMYVAAINMTEADQRAEMEGIADNKGSLIHIDDFNTLAGIFKRAFISQCRCK